MSDAAESMDNWAYGAGGAALGQAIAGLNPLVSFMNAGSGFMTGQDIYGNQMNGGDIVMAGFGAVPGGGNVKYSAATYKALSKQLQQHGMKSLLKTQISMQARLAEHLNKLSEIKKMGGFSSSVEREIRTFQSKLDAISDILK